MKKVLSACVGLLVLTTTASDFAIDNVIASQQFPWEGKVHISFRVSGDVEAINNVSSESKMLIMARDGDSGEVFGSIDTGSPFLSGDTTFCIGWHRIVWDMASEGLNVDSTNIVFTVSYWDNELYLVVDLSPGPTARYYPVTYLYNIPEEGWSDTYKTTKLVLKRIQPCTFVRSYRGVSCDATLTTPYYIGIFEVTRRQYELVMGESPSGTNDDRLDDRLPVTKVSYDMIRGTSEGSKWPFSASVDSASFMGRLRARTGLHFDLPTETQRDFVDENSYGRFWNNRKDGAGGYDYTGYAIVGSYAPNSKGLYDLGGNVCEWCRDRFGDLIGGIDPVGAPTGDEFVVCDYSWCDYSQIPHRYGAEPSRTDTAVGFRVVRTLSNY